MEQIAVMLGQQGLGGLNTLPLGSGSNPLSGDSPYPNNDLISGLGREANQFGGLFNMGANSLLEGLNGGFLPQNLDRIEQGLRPAVERSFERGAASIREQNALTGNLSGSGASQQIADYRGGLEAGLQGQLANIYGGALPAGISAQSGLTNLATLGIPGFQMGLLGQSQGLAQYNQGFPLQLLQTAFGGGAQGQYIPGQESPWPGVAQTLGTAAIAKGAA